MRLTISTHIGTLNAYETGVEQTINDGEDDESDGRLKK